MAGRKRKGVAAGESANPRIQKRKPRTGPKRSKNLVMLDENVTWLEMVAVKQRTEPSEIIQDWIEERRRRVGAAGNGSPAGGDADAA